MTTSSFFKIPSHKTVSVKNKKDEEFVMFCQTKSVVNLVENIQSNNAMAKSWSI